MAVEAPAPAPASAAAQKVSPDSDHAARLIRYLLNQIWQATTEAPLCFGKLAFTPKEQRVASLLINIVRLNSASALGAGLFVERATRYLKDNVTMIKDTVTKPLVFLFPPCCEEGNFWKLSFTRAISNRHCGRPQTT